MRTLLASLLLALPTAAQDVNEQTERALKDAAASVAPCVVKIETAGGSELIGGGSVQTGGVRRGSGPTTGLIVDADGYIVTSSFNFANKPSDIFVTVPGRSGRLVAKQIATDTTRMLTLIKVDASQLQVPAAVPANQFVIGQWAAALGRTLPSENDPPSASVGIISAVGRMNGKLIQTDAKVSPVNYGGPLVAIDGRVLGVLVPASPRGEGDAAGVEWYDSGIGFAVPLADVFAVLPRLKQGKDLKRGLLGITAKSQEPYGDPVEVATVAPDSAASKGGIKPNDRIQAIDGKPIDNYTRLQHVLGPKYEGDKVAVTVVRDGKSVELKDVTLSGAVSAYVPSYLGLLPMRDDPDAGVLVRWVFPGSPAEAAGLKVGDRVTSLAPTQPADAKQAPVKDRTQLATLVGRFPPGTEVKLEVKRKDGGKTETLTAKLGTVPEITSDVAPPRPNSLGKAKPAKKETADGKVEEPAKPEVGLLKRKNATLGREFWVYVPENYDPAVSHGLIVWLHPSGKGGKDADDMARIWKPFLDDYHYILVGPQAGNPTGWTASETEAVVQDIKQVTGQYTVDPSRVVAHGMGVGGQFAFYLGFHARDLVRGVATTGAALGTQPKDGVPGQPLSFFVIGGDKDPAIKQIEATKPALAEKRYPVVYKRLAEFGKEYTDQKTLLEMCVWIETLDKI